MQRKRKKCSHRIPSFSSCVSVFIPSRALRVPATLPPRSITMMMRRETGCRVPVKVTYRLTGLVGKKPAEQKRKRKNPGQTRVFSNSTMGGGEGEICRSRGGKRIACKTDSCFQPSEYFFLKKSPNQLVPFVSNAIKPFLFSSPLWVLREKSIRNSSRLPNALVERTRTALPCGKTKKISSRTIFEFNKEENFVTRLIDALF